MAGLTAPPAIDRPVFVVYVTVSALAPPSNPTPRWTTGPAAEQPTGTSRGPAGSIATERRTAALAFNVLLAARPPPVASRLKTRPTFFTVAAVAGATIAAAPSYVNAVRVVDLRLASLVPALQAPVGMLLIWRKP